MKKKILQILKSGSKPITAKKLRAKETLRIAGHQPKLSTIYYALRSLKSEGKLKSSRMGWYLIKHNDKHPRKGNALNTIDPEKLIPLSKDQLETAQKFHAKNQRKSPQDKEI